MEKELKEKIQETISKGDNILYICPKCNTILREQDMGLQCKNCKDWTYGYLCRRRFYQLLKELLKAEEKKPKRCPDVFIERAAQCTREGIQAICGTDEEYSEYVKKFKEDKTEP